ncbi:unnamed protein product, partial [Notodromas monacha]
MRSVGLLEDLPVAEEIKRGLLKEYFEEFNYLKNSTTARKPRIAGLLLVFTSSPQFSQFGNFWQIRGWLNGLSNGS